MRCLLLVSLLVLQPALARAQEKKAKPLQPIAVVEL